MKLTINGRTFVIEHVPALDPNPWNVTETTWPEGDTRNDYGHMGTAGEALALAHEMGMSGPPS